MSKMFKAYRVEQSDDGIRGAIRSLELEELPAGDVLIEVHWSSLNYKDALAAQGHPGVVRRLPHVPGIDAAGTVVQSQVPEYSPGQSVIVTGYELGSTHWGGWSQYIRVPAAWIVPLPEPLTVYEAMVYGTAGFTAAQCVRQLQRNQVFPDSGPVVVTGSTGGVGCLAVAILSKLGYNVTASSGKADAREWLLDLGASEVVPREEVCSSSDKPLLAARWAGAVDTVGGRTLETILRETQPFGCVTACGLVGGTELNTTVHPFILRGVILSGISSSLCPDEPRRELWNKLAGEWRLPDLERLTRTAQLVDIAAEVDRMLKGSIRGRVVVRNAPSTNAG
jgi:putative YhdH/YhfP family quinone oxidoreductase